MSLDRIKEDAEARSITRLCHLTPLRNLVHIATGGQGLLSTLELSDSERAVFNAVDRERYDNHPDHISCTVQYPNAWYLRSKQLEARGEVRLFPDWVCLLLRPHHLWRDGTRFCERNAAYQHGALIRDGWEGYQAMFADSVAGAGGTWIRRGHPASCPTDAQAEVLVARRIPLDDIIAIAVASSEQAGDTHVILDQLGAETHPPFVVAPDLFSPYRLKELIPKGRLPVESAWDSGANVALAQPHRLDD